MVENKQIYRKILNKGIKQQKEKIKKREENKEMKKILKEKEKGITLIALVITVLFSYDEKLKCSNSKGFLLQTI